MSSAVVAGPSSLMIATASSAASATGSFNPLHLFECTITNASMLVDSMPTRDLLIALRVLAGLHTHIVEVMEPSVGVACQLADAHRACRCCQVQSVPQPPKQTPPQPPPQQQQQPHVKSDHHQQKPKPAALASEDEAANSNNGDDDDEDCVMIIEDDEEEPEDSKVALQGVIGCSGQARNGNNNSNDTSGGVDDSAASSFKDALMQCYKDMKGTGTHLFDFAKPFEDPGNLQIAKSVISYAQTKIGNRNMSSSQWQAAIQTEIFNVFGPYRLKNKKSYSRTRRKKQKLARRQKALECALQTLDSVDIVHYRTVLSREFTSSDEESEDEYGRVSLRARKFDWESDRVREIKRRLDELFLKRFATQKQRVELARHLLREGRARSNRPPPEGAPAWAVCRTGGSGGGCGGGGD